MLNLPSGNTEPGSDKQHTRPCQALYEMFPDSPHPEKCRTYFRRILTLGLQLPELGSPITQSETFTYYFYYDDANVNQ